MEYKINNFESNATMASPASVAHDTPQNQSTPEIRAGSVMANVKRPLLETKNRFEYLNKYLGPWKESIRYKLIVIALSIFSLWALFNFPYILPITIPLIVYYQKMFNIIQGFVLSSKRKVIEAG